MALIPPLLLLLFLGVLFTNSVRILREYERGVVFQLGRFWQVKGPGLILLIPGIHQMVRMDLRTLVLEVPPQDLITKDNVSVKVSAVIYFRVVAPQQAVIEVENYNQATSQLAQTMLRSVLGQHTLDELLSARDQLNMDIQHLLDATTESWGIKVSNVEIKQVDIDSTLVQALARQAEAERERRAKIINAEGEFQAAEKLVAAAALIHQQPAALQLRYLQALSQLAGDRTSTVIFPLPIDLISVFMDRAKAVVPGA